jgi:hypothetical protein
MNTAKTKAIAADKADMDEKTARRYVKLNKLPSQCKPQHNWRTRIDPFESHWPFICGLLETSPSLEAKTIFQALQRDNSGMYQDSQVRTLQRKVKIWRATYGKPKEVFFPQQHFPGRLAASDFTHMSSLKITIGNEPFDHLLFHFVLTYSNWETGSICFTESFESLAQGLQNALWQLGRVPLKHRIDRMSAAVHKECNAQEFTRRYQALLSHYKIQGEKINAGCGNENGDIEQSHRRFKSAVNQALLLRGNRNFNDIAEYEIFLTGIFARLNANRKELLKEELTMMRELPTIRLDDFSRQKVKVGLSSIIRIRNNSYSVNSRLIGEYVEAHIYINYIEIWYAQKLVETMPLIRGKKHYQIQYRHIIDWLIRKPGAFENYRYKEGLFPSSHFRIAYDYLKEHNPLNVDKEYLKILYLAAKENEVAVENALRRLFLEERTVSYLTVESIVKSSQGIAPCRLEAKVDDIDLTVYNQLLQPEEACV